MSITLLYIKVLYIMLPKLCIMFYIAVPKFLEKSFGSTITRGGDGGVGVHSLPLHFLGKYIQQSFFSSIILCTETSHRIESVTLRRNAKSFKINFCVLHSVSKGLCCTFQLRSIWIRKLKPS